MLCDRCDIIASGVINAAKNIGLKKPVIIRLKGTNVDAAKKLIAVRILPCLFPCMQRWLIHRPQGCDVLN
jgi:succinyl-CoA synthetase beta subunit